MSVAFAGVTAMSETVKVYVLFYEQQPIINLVQHEGMDAPTPVFSFAIEEESVIQAYSFTTEQDAGEFERALGDDAWGWLRTHIFWTSEEARQHVQDRLSRSEGGNPQRDRLRFLDPPSLVVARTPPFGGGAPTPEKIKVYAVHGQDQTVRENVKDDGVDGAINSYEFSTEEDVAEFLRALEFLQPWGKTTPCRTMEEALELQAELQGEPA
jgi:hypothetical protein